MTAHVTRARRRQCPRAEELTLTSLMQDSESGRNVQASAAALGYDARLRVVGTGPPLVFVPGMDGTGELFYKQVPRLAHRFRVATYRLRDDPPDMATLVADLARVIDAVADGEPALLVGESFGGALTMAVLMLFLHLEVRTLLVIPWIMVTAVLASWVSPWFFVITAALIIGAGFWWARGALVVGLVIPVSIVGTFVFLNMMGR